MAVTALSGQRWQGLKSGSDTLSNYSGDDTDDVGLVMHTMPCGLGFEFLTGHALIGKKLSSVVFYAGMSNLTSDTDVYCYHLDGTTEPSSSYKARSNAVNTSAWSPQDNTRNKTTWTFDTPATVAVGDRIMLWIESSVGTSANFSMESVKSSVKTYTELKQRAYEFRGSYSAKSQGMRFSGFYDIDDKDSVTDVPAGSEFEQTDDYKSYQYGGVADGLGSAGDAGSNNGTLDETNEKLGTGCLDFNGSDQTIDADILTSVMTTTGSVSLWFNSDASQERILWSVQDASASVGLEVKTRTDGKCAINGSGGGMSTLELVSTETFTDTNWVHLVITQDGTNCKIYVNGTVGQSGTDTGDWISDISGIDGGNFACKAPRNSNPIDEFFNGKLDDIGIWDRALTSGEVSSLYGGGSSPQLCTTIPSGLKVYYNCDSATVKNNAVGWVERGTAI